MGLSLMFCCTNGLDRKGRRKKQSMWRVFSLKELHAATNSFNYDNKLGEGSYGSVYWGQLWDGSQIAVKRLKIWSNKTEREFSVELEILARVRHKNLLSLRGFCSEGQERVLVYDYVPNMSLLSHLHGQHSTECLLDWNRRIKIAIGAGEGIAYLHHNSTPHIIHGDIKASNVLLDPDFQAKIADFGFAKIIFDGVTNMSTKVKGNRGYIPPEYDLLGKTNERCDVYSFGVLLLELVSCKRPIEKLSPKVERTIIDWALPLACKKNFNEIADPRLNGKFVEEELKRVVIVALICTHRQPEKRPNMLEVLDLLKGESKNKLAELENDKLFKEREPGSCDDKSSDESSPDVKLDEEQEVKDLTGP